MDKDILKVLLKEHLRVRLETRCAGHMSPIEDWLVVVFDDEPIVEVMIGQETFD